MGESSLTSEFLTIQKILFGSCEHSPVSACTLWLLKVSPGEGGEIEEEGKKEGHFSRLSHFEEIANHSGRTGLLLGETRRRHTPRVNLSLSSLWEREALPQPGRAFFSLFFTLRVD